MVKITNGTVTTEVTQRRGRGLKVLYSKASIDVYEISGYVIRGNLQRPSAY